MRGLKTCIALGLLNCSNIANAQDSGHTAPPFIYEITKNGSLLGGYGLTSEGTITGGVQNPCAYTQVLRLNTRQMCPPTGAPQEPPQVDPSTNPCATGLCPPTVGIGGTTDPSNNRALSEVLPNFEKFGIKTFDLKPNGANF